MSNHYEGPDLIVRKFEVGDFENNIYVLECPETHDAFLVDASFDADRIITNCAGANIVGILMTHGHFDHVQALAELKDKLDVPVHAHPGDDYPVPVQELSDGDVLKFGTCSLTVFHTPGHTPGGTCYRSGDHLISGDTLFPGGPGATHDDKAAFAQIIDAISSKLFVLPDETNVYPGHGADTTIGKERPHLDEWIERGW